MTPRGFWLRRTALWATVAGVIAAGIALKWTPNALFQQTIPALSPVPPPDWKPRQGFDLLSAAELGHSMPSPARTPPRRTRRAQTRGPSLRTANTLPAEPAHIGPVLLQRRFEIVELVVCHSDDEAWAGADFIQGCIDRAAPNTGVEILPGRYELHHQLVISKPLTIRTATPGSDLTSACTGDETQCAVFIATPDFAAQWGPLLVQSTSHVTLEHIVIDGNRATRSDSEAARRCRDGDNTYGFNVSVLDCASCTVTDVVSTRAVCGTGMVWVGAGATIQRSAFRANGDSATRMWSDGLTLLFAPWSVISDNEFVDNTDVALIIGYGVDARLERNTVVQRTQPAFAGLMLDNFDSNDLTSAGDFRGAVVAHNQIDCGAQLCTFGIQIGPRPWHATQNIIGGELHDNEVRGAKIGINADGAGVANAPTTVYGNSIEGVSPGGHFAACADRIPTNAINVAPRSVVDRRGDPMQAGSHPSDWCQLWSDIAGEE
jgi:hypothetical protein